MNGILLRFPVSTVESLQSQSCWMQRATGPPNLWFSSNFPSCNARDAHPIQLLHTDFVPQNIPRSRCIWPVRTRSCPDSSCIISTQCSAFEPLPVGWRTRRAKCLAVSGTCIARSSPRDSYLQMCSASSEWPSKLTGAPH
jgi:hypothetical protein